MMNDAERIWRDRSDEDLLEAAAELGQFTEQGQAVIRAELKRRGLEDPVDQANSEAEAIDPPGDEPEGAPGSERVIGEEGAGDADGRLGARGPECLRCDVALEYRGTRRFHEGTHWGALGEIGHLFEKSESFDVYVCPNCGHVDLFVDGVGEDSRPG
jgi:hypothetical protein